MDDLLNDAAPEIQQVFREMVTIHQEIRKLGLAYDELQKAAFAQLEAEWEETYLAFIDSDQPLKFRGAFACDGEIAPFLICAPTPETGEKH